MKNEDIQNLRNMLRMLPKYKRKIFWIFFLVCSSAIIVLIQPQIWSRLLNGITINFSMIILIFYAVMMLTSQVFEIFFDLLQVRITQMVQQSLVVEMRKKLISNVINMQIQNFLLINKGELLSRIVSDTEEIANGIVGELISIVINVVKIVLIGIFLCLTNIYLGIFTIVFQTIISFILHRHENKIRKKCMESSKVNDSYFADMEMIIGGVVEIQNLRIENEISKKVDFIVEKKKEVYLDLVKCNMRYQAEVQIVNFVYQFLILVIGIQFLDVGMMNFQDFVAFSSYSSVFTTAITAMYGLKASYINCFNSMKRFFQLFDNYGINISNINKNKNKNVQVIDLLLLQDVSFSYLPEQMIVKNVNARFEKGKLNCIIGKSGVGKTTLLMVMLGFYTNYQGTIVVNECDEKKERIDCRNLGMVLVSQNPFFLECSIYENLSIVNRNKKKEDIEFVCKTIGLHDEIINMSKGYETPLLNNASNLSTGQRQRLAIARTLLLDFQVLLCDEILANVDIESKNKILTAIRRIANNKIVILVTHQLDIIESDDYVVNLSV